jgi:hypothetical protein
MHACRRPQPEGDRKRAEPTLDTDQPSEDCCNGVVSNLDPFSRMPCPEVRWIHQPSVDITANEVTGRVGSGVPGLVRN